MRRSIVVLLEIAVLIVLFRLPFVQYVIEDAQREVSGWFQYLATWQERNELQNLQELAAPQLSSLRPYQQDYVTGLLHNGSELKEFHSTYCGKAAINPFLKGIELAQFCHTIESTRILTLKG
ncbi:hypothetical protein [Aestuariibacter sp. A3R04]|uniref:hypothetical protein n=1 Tax=Aestuariibacter sp. A3R04 TaxID=2841571 RepID=UPI001C090273|nr:hypothetical protein [Aestuariibacter sp. A3R04]MBU3021044.1 hypothetical protein [Aestuariibacter sp. A3R04]